MSTTVASTLLEALVGGPNPYDPIGPVESALEALAAYFATVSGIASARRGWPEEPVDLDLSHGPVVAVTHIVDRETPVAASPIPDSSPTLHRVAELEIDVQVDLFAPYRATLDTASRALADALDNDLPWQSGLHLVSRGYHERPLVATADRGSYMDPDQAAQLGEWRRSWYLTVRTDRVRSLGLPVQTDIILVPTVDGLAEPETSV